MADIALSEVGQARQVALVRLLLAFTGHTHQWLTEYSDKAATVLRRNYSGPADARKVLGLLKANWLDAFEDWEDSFHSARREAALIAFGELAIAHTHFMGGIPQGITESGPDLPPVFERQLEEVLAAAAGRVHGDGFKLSQRIWRLEQDSFEGIRRTVMGGISEQKSAWELAKDVESYLGVYADCPRWTATRLYGLTKADIAAGDRRGLLKGPDCSPERGVAYNALRLARTEITMASHDATQTIHNRSPWVTGSKWNLSPAHPKPDICDTYAQGGPNGDGVYPPGDAPSIPHPHCLCYLTAVQMSDDAFRGKMRGWVNGTAGWSGMDRYAASVRRTPATVSDLAIVAGLEDALYRWIFEIPDAIQPWLPGLEP